MLRGKMKIYKTCIQCPLGCRIVVKKEGKKILEIKGNDCTIGERYVIQEITNPERVITTTVFVKGGEIPLLPVRSEKPIPKNLVKEAIKELSTIVLNAPIKCGEVVYKNIAGTGINIISCRDLHKYHST